MTLRNLNVNLVTPDSPYALTEQGESPDKGVEIMQVQAPESRVHSVRATGSELLATIKNLIHAGNVRRITIKQEGHTIAEFPLTFGVVGAALAPALAAIGAIAALVTDCTIEIERDDLPAGVGS